MLGSLLGGAMFGDNLSFISDTTIAATQTLGCSMKDKFKVNVLIAGPASLLTIAFLLFAGGPTGASLQTLPTAIDFSYLHIAPYLLVIALALSGVNVFVVLVVGTVASGFVGLYDGSLNPLLFSKKVYEGFTGMTEIFLLSMLTGGLVEMVREAGGIQYLLNKVSSIISGYRSAQMGIGLLVSGVNTAIANNTVSIVVSGPVAKEIGHSYEVDRRKSAAIVDIFACIIQGLLPYGAQMLIILNFTSGKLTYIELLPYAWYLLLIFVVLAILTPFVDRYLLKNFAVAKSEMQAVS